MHFAGNQQIAYFPYVKRMTTFPECGREANPF